MEGERDDQDAGWLEVKKVINLSEDEGFFFW